MQYAKPTCLKLFHIYRKSNFTPPEIHGVNFEPQIGLFLNENSNDYVHMFFGKVASGDNKDGFIVTQFLDKTTIPIKAYNSQRYYIEQTDRKSANKINDIYVDYGGVIVKRR